MKENKQTYTCFQCNYNTQKKFNYKCHLMTKKHKIITKKDEKDEKDDQNKIKSYSCYLCNFVTYKYSNYVSHVNTNKHKTKIQTKEKKSSELFFSEEIIYEIVQSNKQMLEIIQNGTNNININNNNNNNTFNLNIFLNKTCKDAINMKDFLESIEVSITDLKKLGNKGYVEGISSLMIDKLNELDITKRPIHSTDAKRCSIYIKDNNIWEKDEKNKMIEILWSIARLETQALENKYKREYPKCETDRDSKEHNEYWRIFYNAMGGNDGEIDDLQKKVIKKIAKNITI